jgi:hypothetical protein
VNPLTLRALSTRSTNIHRHAEVMIGAAPGATITMYVMNALTARTFSQFADAYAAVVADMPAKAPRLGYERLFGFRRLLRRKRYDSTLEVIDADLAGIVADGGTPFADTGIWDAGRWPSEALSGGEIAVEFPASGPKPPTPSA